MAKSVLRGMMEAHNQKGAAMRQIIFASMFIVLAGPSVSTAQRGGGGMGGGGLGGGGLGGGGLGGGIMIDAKGVLRPSSPNDAKKQPPITPDLDREMAARVDLRQISLRRLDQQLRQAVREKKEIPVEVHWLAGIVKIEYVIFDLANRDILIAGPAEGWRITADGRATGTRSKRPVLYLGDLAAALRCVLKGPGEVFCSIDPQREGLAAARKYFSSQSSRPIAQRDVDDLRDEFTRRLELQTVATRGVPDGSRFARVLIEADYRMKRMAMGAEKVAGLPTHLDAVAEHTESGDTNPSMARWWFTTRYDPFLRNSESTVFRLRGPAVQLMNEEMLVADDGRLQGVGRASRDWDRFSQTFTKLFSRIETQYPVFADLRNLFDLMMVAGLIRQQNASDWLAGSALLESTAYSIPSGSQPRHAEPVFTYRFHGRTRKKLFSIAYGGVSIRPSDALAAAPPAVDTAGELGAMTVQPLAAPASSDSSPEKADAAKSDTAGRSSAASATSPSSNDRPASDARWWSNLKVDGGAPSAAP